MKKNNIGSPDMPAEGIAQDLFHIETYIKGLSVFIVLCNKTARSSAAFLNILGNNPLELSICPEIESWGCITYRNVLSVRRDEAIAPIADLYRISYDRIQKYL